MMTHPSIHSVDALRTTLGRLRGWLRRGHRDVTPDGMFRMLLLTDDPWPTYIGTRSWCDGRTRPCRVCGGQCCACRHMERTQSARWTDEMEAALHDRPLPPVVELDQEIDCCARAAGRHTRGGPDHCGLCGKPFDVPMLTAAVDAKITRTEEPA